ncbi:MAG: ribbon-helix-helix protein, CopG family [Desulfobulbus sp.]|nr:ribbon-helix-helix protein, CopG family [Desulfobulbus sp.]
MFTIRLPEEMERRLTVLADTTKRPKSFYVREALERGLDDIEDAYLAEAALEKFRVSGEKAVPLEEVERRLGLAD